jgi:hypothetical protein
MACFYLINFLLSQLKGDVYLHLFFFLEKIIISFRDRKNIDIVNAFIIWASTFKHRNALPLRDYPPKSYK